MRSDRFNSNVDRKVKTEAIPIRRVEVITGVERRRDGTDEQKLSIKYACACGEAVAQAPAPARLIEGGIPTEALVADVVVSKYADHLPLYRQAQIFSRQGLPLDRSTLAAWVGAAAAELEPLYERLVAILKGMDKLFADETRCPVLDPGRGKTKPGSFWALACDDRPWGSQTPPAVISSYAPGRGGKHVETLLEGFSGVLQVDGYDGYIILVRSDRRGGEAEPVQT